MNRVLGFILFVLVATIGVLTQSGALIGSNSIPGNCIEDKGIIEDIKKKQAEIKQKEKELVEREDELKNRETALSEEMIKLEELRVEIAKQKTINDKISEEIMTKLVETFEKMSPKAAAKLLATLDDSLAVTAMSKVSTQSLSKIMNIMDPEKASHLAELLALGESKRKERDLARQLDALQKQEEKNE